MLNPSATRETDYGWSKSPSSKGSERTMDRRIQTGLLCYHNIGGYNIGLEAHSSGADVRLRTLRLQSTDQFPHHVLSKNYTLRHLLPSGCEDQGGI